MQHPALLTLSRPLPSGERSRWRRAGLRPAPALSRYGSVFPRRGWVSRRAAPGLLSNSSGLSPGIVRHEGWGVRSISPLSHSHRAHCERLAAFTAASSSLLSQQGLGEGTLSRKHISAAFSLSAIPPFSSSSFLAACPDPSQGCSRLSPPAALCHTQSTGWTQTKANWGRRCCESHCHSPRRTPCSPPSRYLASAPPALLSPRVQNCSDAFSAAASSPRSNPFPEAEENSHSFTFIPSQVTTLSPSPTPPLGSRDTQHPAILPMEDWLRKGRYPGWQHAGCHRPSTT